MERNFSLDEKNKRKPPANRRMQIIGLAMVLVGVAIAIIGVYKVLYGYRNVGFGIGGGSAVMRWVPVLAVGLVLAYAGYVVMKKK